jgi:biotin carboxyl carrier protein
MRLAPPSSSGRPAGSAAGRGAPGALAVLAAALLAAGCTSAAPAAAPSAPADATADVAVPDAFTAVVVRPLGAPTFPFLGSDGKYHIVYDLELTNAAAIPATIDKIDVVDAAKPDTVIASYAGTTLVAPDCQAGDCNRLRRLPSSVAADNVIPAQESRAMLVDFMLDSAEQAPVTVLHHLYAHAAVNPGSKEPVATDYLAAPFAVSAGAPRVIGPPVKGDRWIAANGCCLPGFPHRTSLATFNGMLVNGQRFAIDWKQTDESGAFYQGDRTKNESYVDYGAPIYAVADGTITSTVDKLDANAPGVLPAADPVLGPQITVETVDGNHIVQDIGGGLYAFYAHLQRGSLLVKPGDVVTKGQVIAKLGNTGNANASHMHFHLMNGPSVLGSDGVPYVLDGFTYEGQVPAQAFLDADDYLSGNFLQGRLPTPQPRTNELPLFGAIVDFPA